MGERGPSPRGGPNQSREFMRAVALLRVAFASVRVWTSAMTPRVTWAASQRQAAEAARDQRRAALRADAKQPRHRPPASPSGSRSTASRSPHRPWTRAASTCSASPRAEPLRGGERSRPAPRAARCCRAPYATRASRPRPVRPATPSRSRDLRGRGPRVLLPPRAAAPPRALAARAPPRSLRGRSPRPCTTTLFATRAAAFVASLHRGAR